MREQRTQLNRKPSTEVQQGQFGAGRTQTVNMPIVTPAKSSGAKLAEAFGMAVQATGKIVAIEQDKKQKRKAIFDSVEGNTQGTAKAREIIKQSKELPLEQRNAFIQNGLHQFMEGIKGQDTTDAYVRGVLGAYTAHTDKSIESNISELETIKTNDLALATTGAIKTDFLNGEKHSTIMEKIKTINDVGNAQAGKIYVKSVAALIKEEAQTNPSYDWQTAIENTLKIQSEDGTVDYTTHPEYGKMIDTLETSLTTLATSRASQQAKAAKQQAVNTTKSILSTLYKDTLTPEEIVQAQVDIEENQDMFTVEQYKTLQTALDNAQDEVGYASTSNPEMFNKVNALAQQGKLSVEALNMWKGNLTKSEYNTVFGSIAKSDDEKQDTHISLVKNGLNDLEKVGRRQVADVNEFGIALTNNDAEKIAMFEQSWNLWLVNYQREKGTYPTIEEGISKQKELVKTVNEAFNIEEEALPQEEQATPPTPTGVTKDVQGQTITEYPEEGPSLIENIEEGFKEMFPGFGGLQAAELDGTIDTLQQKYGSPDKFEAAEQDLGRELTDMEETIISVEGWTAHTDIKGHKTGKGGVKDYESFDAAMKAKKDVANRMFPKYNYFPEDVQKGIILALYRGDMGPTTKKLINEGKWKEASEEFLEHDEYKEYKSKGVTNSITDRIEYLSNALANLER